MTAQLQPPVAASTDRDRRVTGDWIAHVGLPALLAVMVLAAPFVVSRRLLSFLIVAGIYAIAAYGLSFLFGQVGLFSVAHAGIWGVGAYLGAILGINLGIGFWFGLPIVLVFGFAFSWLVGYPALRVGGHYFLIVTFALGEFIVLLIANLSSLTNGRRGLAYFARPSAIGPLSFETREAMYWLVVGALVLSIVAVSALRRSTFGKRLIAVRDEQRLAQAVGINAPIMKVQAFAVSGMFAALAGHIFVYFQNALVPDLFEAWASVQFIAIIIVGGSVGLTGPLLGSLFLVLLPELFSLSPIVDRILTGTALLVFILALPEGITGFLKKIGRQESPPVERTVRARAVTPERVAAPVDAPTLLKIENVSKSFRGVKALNAVDLEVRAGQIRGLIGPNGAGKTTLFNVATGFMVPDSGRVQFLDDEITASKPHIGARKGLIRTFQQGLVFGTMTPLESFAMATAASSGKGRQALSAEEILEIVNLEAVRNRPAADLPFGERRLLGLGIALASAPRVLLLDEPAAGLNDAETEHLLEVLLRICREGIAMCLVDHDMSLIMPACERITVLDSGTVILDGTPEEVAADPRVAEVYLGKGIVTGDVMEERAADA